MTPRTGRAVTLAATVVLAGATSTAPAIAADTLLTQRQKQTLLEIYESFTDTAARDRDR